MGPFLLNRPPDSQAVNGQRLELGIRPEHLRVSLSGPGVPAEVQVVELAGSETFLHLMAGGRGSWPGSGLSCARASASRSGSKSPSAGSTCSTPIPAGPWSRRHDRHPGTLGLALMLAPYLVGLTLLIVVPGVVAVSLALFEYDLIRPADFVGLHNFRELAGDQLFWTSLRNSLHYVAFAVPLRLLGALGLALLLHRRFRAVGGYRTAAYLPTVVPDVAYALVWLWIFNPLYGPMNILLGAVGAPNPVADRRRRDPGGGHHHEPVPDRRGIPGRDGHSPEHSRRAV